MFDVNITYKPNTRTTIIVRADREPATSAYEAIKAVMQTYNISPETMESCDCYNRCNGAASVRLDSGAW